MKFAITLFALGLTLSACGQKGPLIVEPQSDNSTPVTEPKSTEHEVSEKKSVLNTQTEETSPTR